MKLARLESPRLRYSCCRRAASVARTAGLELGRGLVADDAVASGFVETQRRLRDRRRAAMRHPTGLQA
eukprot:12217656-Alexandrium_andersonii.AAC.1